MNDRNGFFIRSEIKFCNGLNAIFASIGQKLNSAIPQTSNDFEIESNFSIHIYPCKEQEVRTIIKTFKNKPSTGMDDTSNIIIKLSFNQVVPHLTNIINSSMKNGMIQKFLSQAKVLPFFKKN